MKKINLKDKEIEKIINNEQQRQEEHIELIASENYVSKDVLEATGSILTNKYSEGYPGARYYDGCEFVDQIETLAIERLKKLFNVKFANVQPHSGSSANSAAIAALVKPGGKILGMSLDAGGHLTHGYKISFSGTFYDPYFYGVNDEGLLDYDVIEKLAEKIKPELIICGASNYSRTIDFEKFSKIAKKVGAFLLADIAHIAGLIIADLHPSPVGHADVITSTTHKTIRGARGGIIMSNDETLMKKIDRWVFPGYQGGPLVHVIAGKAVAFGEALTPQFKKYQQQIISNAKAFSEEFKKVGTKIISGQTDNHLFTIDVKSSFNISGKEASELMHSINITANKNSIPNDTLGPKISSGVRMGTPAMTTRGFKEVEFKKLARIIIELLANSTSSNLESLKLKLKNEVLELTKAFPTKDYYL
ncbi:serine hydroxymethyltransferase [[Mycoplasma] mobile]|uniref:Serine hydroxymethyltransferase n=1 Tax=Mycoplasma mobile (strain ATCC 43663 / 163K / NCTC 11711) TaxID=267748 RepID=GLYA_MYCM1|nr:serine hydroxymethyltransferase [[Mycoplasma] mobile]Q6KHH3.1 RecName: Full=Serine hydroxymethyltransferase; Short=SHMT; Short=Serine methylase [Mycoplasma mobile 163K]AAT27957.1 serine hydroxymethyltransferase [Mycoplasma mobile 163K]